MRNYSVASDPKYDLFSQIVKLRSWCFRILMDINKSSLDLDLALIDVE